MESLGIESKLCRFIKNGRRECEFGVTIRTGVGWLVEAEGLPAFMQSFLDRGGVALITPSEPFSASISMIKQSGLLDFSFSKVEGGASRSGEVFRIAALAEESPLSKIFSGKASRDLYLTSFFALVY